MTKDLYLISTFERLRNLYPAVSKLLATSLIQYLSSMGIYNHSSGSSGKQKRLRVLKIPFLRACDGISAHVEKKYALPELHVHFATAGKTAQRNGLFTEDGLRGMLEGKRYYVVHMDFLFIA